MSMFNSNGLKRRAIYKYICTECGNSRASFIYERALGKVCMACQKNKPDANQSALFDGSFFDGSFFDGSFQSALFDGSLVINESQKKAFDAAGVDTSGMILNQPVPEGDQFFSESEAEYAIKKVNEQRKQHQEDQKNKQYNQVLDAEVEGEQTKRDQFFTKHGSDIVIQKEVVEEDVVLFTFKDRTGLYVTGEYFRWKVVDFFANAEYFMDDLPLVYSAGLEVDLLLAKQ